MTEYIADVPSGRGLSKMPRDREKVRHQLQEAGLRLFLAYGYDRVTASEIAEDAGVTERTFFRHFADKREVLFDGEAILSSLLAGAVRDAPPSLGPWPTMYRAFRATTGLMAENRRFAEPRRLIIETNPSLQERERTKADALARGLAAALRMRGVPDQKAALAAQLGMVAFSQALAAWLDDGRRELHQHLFEAFQDVRDLSAER